VPTFFLKLKGLLEPFGITRYHTDGWGVYERPLKQSNTRWARIRRKRSRASTSGSGHESNAWFVVRFAFLRRSGCTIWSLGCSSTAMNSVGYFDIRSTPLRHPLDLQGTPWLKKLRRPGQGRRFEWRGKCVMYQIRVLEPQKSCHVAGSLYGIALWLGNTVERRAS